MAAKKKKTSSTKRKSTAKKSTAKKTPTPKKSSTSKKKSTANKVATRRKVVAPLAKSPSKQSSPPSHEYTDHIKVIREIAAIIERRSLTEVGLDLPEFTLSMRRDNGHGGTTFVQSAPVSVPIQASPAVTPTAPQQMEAAPVSNPEEDRLNIVTSPFVGTFYRRPNPDADAYVEMGQRVEKGQTLCIVEAMKLMNEIEADGAGTIVSILVEDAQPVEYGQALFKIDPL